MIIQSDKDKVFIASIMLTVSQVEYERMLTMLKYQANFILKNIDSKLAEIVDDKDKSLDFFLLLNDLQVTFDSYLAAKDKYTLTDETKKCIKEAEELKIKLDELANKNWDVEAILNDRQGGRSGGC